MFVSVHVSESHFLAQTKKGFTVVAKRLLSGKETALHLRAMSMPMAGSPQAATSLQSTRRPVSPNAASPISKMPRPANNFRNTIQKVEEAIGLNDHQALAWSIVSTFKSLADQLDGWVLDMSTHAYTLEGHHSSFYSARANFTKLHEYQVEMEKGAKLKFESVDKAQADMLQNLSKMMEHSEGTLNKFNFELRDRLEKMDAREKDYIKTFEDLMKADAFSNQVVETIASEVEKHSQGFIGLAEELRATQARLVAHAGDATTWQGRHDGLVHDVRGIQKYVEDIVTYIYNLEAKLVAASASASTGANGPPGMPNCGHQVPQEAHTPTGPTREQSQWSPPPAAAPAWDPWRQAAEAAAAAASAPGTGVGGFAPRTSDPGHQNGFQGSAQQTSNCGHGNGFQGSAPQTSNLGHRSGFSDKVAMTREFQYHGKEGGASWRLLIKNCLLSQVPIMETLLRSAESLDDEPATLQTLVNRSLGVSPDILQKMARDLWGVLNLNL